MLDDKTTMQNLVEEYRNSLQDLFGWLDSLAKRSENADKGHGMNISSRVSLLEQLTNESIEGKKKLEALTSKVICIYLLNCWKKIELELYKLFKAGEVTALLSALDSQQVDEQLKVAERRYGDVEKRLNRKQHLIQTTHQGSESAMSDVAQIRQWVAEKTELVRKKEPLGFRTKSAQSKLQQIKVISKYSSFKI